MRVEDLESLAERGSCEARPWERATGVGVER